VRHSPVAAVVLSGILLLSRSACSLAAGGTGGAEGQGRPRPSPAQALVASAAYPGLGQLLTGSEKKAAVIGAVEGFLVARLVLEDRWTRNALRLHKGTGEGRYYDEYSKHFDTRQTLVWWVVVAALYGLGDAYVDAELRDFDDPLPSSLDSALGAPDDDAGGTLRVGFVVQF
jgi:hypothetical protein